MKQLIELLVVATVFSATVFAAAPAQAQTKGLTPSDFTHLHLDKGTSGEIIVHTNSIRKSNDYLVAKVLYVVPTEKTPIVAIELYDCQAGKFKVEREDGRLLNRQWEYVVGKTNIAVIFDHVCGVGRQTGLIK